MRNVPPARATPAIMHRRNLLAALPALAFLAACGRSRKLPAIGPGEPVLAFGDSVTYGTGAGAGEDWPRLLAASTGWRVTNAGVPGETASAAKGRLPGLLAEQRPALVIIEIGGNDFLRRSARGDVKEDIRALIQSVQQASAQPVLIGVPELSLLGLVGKPSDSPIYEELAREENVPLIKDVLSDVLGNADLRADRIHPNAAGYRAMAEGIRAALKRTGLLGSG